MLQIWEAKLDITLESPEPPRFVGMIGKRPSNDFVVSYKKDGTIASYYGELVWDYCLYDVTRRHGKLNFAEIFRGKLSKRQVEIIEEVKWIIFLLIYFKDGKSLSVSGLQKYLVCLRPIARFAYNNKLSIKDVLNNSNLILKHIDSQFGNHSKLISALIFHLIQMGREKTGFVVLAGLTLKDIKIRSNEYRSKEKQTPPIPTRIYSYILSGLINILDEFDKVSDRYLNLIKECAANDYLGRTYGQQMKTANNNGIILTKKDSFPTFKQLIIENSLGKFFQDNGLNFSVSGAKRGLKAMQDILRQIIQALSGMRENEVTRLPFYCTETFTKNSKKHFRIVGSTTKFSNGAQKRARWVTNQEGIRAIAAAQKISMTIYTIMGDCPTETDSMVDAYPLFITTGYLPFTGSGSIKNNDYYIIRMFKSLSVARPDLMCEIEENDLKELERIDPFRDWRLEDNFQVGKNWVLNSHQWRRSLALYASRSGLVSLTSLKRQLQQLTNEMAEYYASGSASAKNLIAGCKDHFAIEYQETQSESQALAYIANVLLTDKRLFGSHGIWVEKSRSDQVNITLEDREKTIDRFKRGEMAWEETHLGGCTKVGRCEKKLMRSVAACIECSSVVIMPEKLDGLIKIQKSFVGRLDPNSKMWLSENTELDSLKAYQKNIAEKFT